MITHEQHWLRKHHVKPPGTKLVLAEADDLESSIRIRALILWTLTSMFFDNKMMRAVLEAVKATNPKQFETVCRNSDLLRDTIRDIEREEAVYIWPE